ncbi:MAG: signal transduction histidine kinase LytS [Bacteroidetes bacterium]|nr:signal transduction histidine kinase LytS [Bacteroidota bacterium]
MDPIYYILIIVLVLVFAGVLFRLRKSERQLKQGYKLLKKENGELLNQIHALELENSKFRLNPHLFKNTLNSIQGYAYRTHQAMEKLGGVLDYILYESNVQYIAIKDELEFVRNFIELNKIKLGPLFDFRFRISVNEGNPFYDEPLVSPLITAYFIENAFKHAELTSKDAFISILFELNDDEFIFTVSNKINKMPHFNPNSGIGKENMKKRLEILYGKACSVDYSVLEEVHIARLQINLRDVKNKVHPAG